jgi:serine/threonine-protein kinase
MSSIPLADLVDGIRENHLLNPAQLDEFTSELQARYANPATLAAELVKRGWLTSYQAEHLLQGHGQELVVGSYLILDCLDEGGMGRVFKARHLRLDRVVALKLIRPERLGHPHAVRRFQREARAAARLSHPNIVTVFDTDQVGPNHFIAMEYVEGVSLEKMLKRHGRLPAGQACSYISQAALGLQHAHERGLVHRDVKPGNLLVAVGGVQVKILDMGLARMAEGTDSDPASGELTETGVMMGTPDYVAPEQAIDTHRADIRADIYSLGCTLYHLLTGELPFPSESRLKKLLAHQQAEPEPVEKLRPDLPKGLGEVVRRMMAKRPEDRYQTPAEAAAALAPFSTPEAEFAQGTAGTQTWAPLPDLEAKTSLVTWESASTPRSDPMPRTQALSQAAAPRPRPAPVPKAATPPPDAGGVRAAPPKPRRGLLLLGLCGLVLVVSAIAVPILWNVLDQPRGPGQPETAANRVVVVGRGEYASLGAALQKARAGDRLLVYPGRYPESIILDKPLEIRGQGPREKIVILGRRNMGFCIDVKTDKATLRGLSLRRYASGRGGPCIDVSQGELTVEDCDINAAQGDGVFVHNPLSRATLRHCLIGSTGRGVLIETRASVTLEDCEVAETGGTAIENGGNFQGNEGGTLVLSRCKIRDSRQYGIQVGQKGKVTAQHCDIRGQVSVGIYLVSGGQGDFRNCQVHHGTGAGLYIGSGGQAVFRNCQVHHGASAGVLVRGLSQTTLIGCEIYANSQAGVDISYGARPLLQRCKIHDGQSSGVLVQSWSGSAPWPNEPIQGGTGPGQVEDCDIYNNALAGVELKQRGRLLVRQSRIKRNRFAGVWARDQATATFENCDLTANPRGAWQIEDKAKVTRKDNKE